MAAPSGRKPPSRETLKKPTSRRRNASLHVSAINLRENLRHAQRALLTKLKTNDTADATMNMRRRAAKRGNMRSDFWRSIPGMAGLAAQRNPLLGRRSLLGLGTALTGVIALGARPGRAETPAASP